MDVCNNPCFTNELDKLDCVRGIPAVVHLLPIPGNFCYAFNSAKVCQCTPEFEPPLYPSDVCYDKRPHDHPLIGCWYSDSNFPDTKCEICKWGHQLMNNGRCEKNIACDEDFDGCMHCNEDAC